MGRSISVDYLGQFGGRFGKDANCVDAMDWFIFSQNGSSLLFRVPFVVMIYGMDAVVMACVMH